MLIFITILIVLIGGFFVVKYIDQQRWDRYQFDRAKFFKTHPYHFQRIQQYSIQIPIGASNQIRLINSLMLNSAEPILHREALIQRMEVQHSQPHQIQVSIANIQIGYLDIYYAKQLTHALKHTDFYVGRPIRVMAKITLNDSRKNCQVHLDLCADPFKARDYLVEHATK